MADRYVRFTPPGDLTPDRVKGRYGVRNTATGEAVLVDIQQDVILEVTEALNLAYAEGLAGAKVASGGVIPGARADDDRSGPLRLDTAYVIPASMVQKITIDLDDDAELRRVPMRPITEEEEAQDTW